MNHLKLTIIFPVLVLLALSLGCDNDSQNNANAQPTPMSGTDVTGKVNAPSEQTCPTLIGGLSANDTLIVEINSTGDMTGDVTITNSSASTSAGCSGTTEDTLPPAEVKTCKVSSSNISGIKVDDILEVDVAFTTQTKEITLANLSGSTGITCAFVAIDTLNATN
ncbi:MAG: hypothetical protein DHS20C13_01390 [Thermodesulfobacteriota bacterium]|nr:MAG: hypothetical protein DHS20C13_01390 [Thermodesulfobacteriota bacterium]